MDIETLRQYCLSKPAVTECFPFDETSLVFKVVDRMFLLVDLEHPDHASMKCNPVFVFVLCFKKKKQKNNLLSENLKFLRM